MGYLPVNSSCFTLFEIDPYVVLRGGAKTKPDVVRQRREANIHHRFQNLLIVETISFQVVDRPA